MAERLAGELIDAAGSTGGAMKKREDDIVWSIELKGQRIYLYLLLEFQSSIDRGMPVRMMQYVAARYDHLVRSKAIDLVDGLPPVLPIVPDIPIETIEAIEAPDFAADEVMILATPPAWVPTVVRTSTPPQLLSVAPPVVVVPPPAPPIKPTRLITQRRRGRRELH